MKVLEHNQNRLILSFRDSLWCTLLFGITLTMGGLFFSILGIAFKQEDNLLPIAWILSLGIGIILIFGGLLWIVKLTKTSTFTFDKAKNCILWEQHNLRNFVIQSVEFPLHLITGITIETSTDTESVSYYARLIIAPLFWRIPLNSSGDYQSAAILAKMLAQFLNVTYFPNESKAPAPRRTQKVAEHIEPWREGWRYIEDEIDRSYQHLSQHPQDAEAHQDLGIALYLLYPFLNRKKAIIYLKQAEKLFEAQQEPDRAAVIRVLQALVR
jgi:hypothetical protein